MINKYLGITLISASVAFVGCSSNDDDDGGPTEPVAMTPETMTPDMMTPEEMMMAGANIEVPTEYTPDDGVTMTLAETFANRGNFTQLLAAVEAGGLNEALGGEGPLTLFAPTDAVFAALPEGALPSDQTELSNLLQGHVVSGALDGALVAASVGSSVGAVNGGSLAITNDGGNLFIGGVQIVETDIQATNGIIHIIDGVIGAGSGDAAPVEMMPEEMTTPPPAPEGGDPDAGPNLGPGLNALNGSGFTDFVSVWTAAQLGTSLDSNAWTVFVPSNDSIPDAALGLDQPGSFDIMNAHIITTGALTPDQLAGFMGTLNNGSNPAIGGSAGALTVQGFAVTPLANSGAAAVYSIDGLLQ